MDREKFANQLSKIGILSWTIQMGLKLSQGSVKVEEGGQRGGGRGI